MSTLSLDDLGPKMRQALGLEASCHWADLKTTCVAAIPVIETTGPAAREPEFDHIPGAAWLRNGLHRLRVPHIPARGYDRPAGPEIS